MDVLLHVSALVCAVWLYLFSEQKCTFSSHFFLKSIEFFAELCYNTFCNSHKKLIGRFLQDVTAPIFLRLFPRYSPVADVFLCN